MLRVILVAGLLLAVGLSACDSAKDAKEADAAMPVPTKSMARSQQIPARFEIGFPLPTDKASSEVAGYHCWAEFFDPQNGWVPVDISEAWKHPEKKDYFFGAHDVNRVQFSIGRDLKLNPPQQGDPLNYFVYPYVEVGGKQHQNVSFAFSFANEGGTQASAGGQ